MALLLDRQALVDGLFKGKAVLGNDSPFAPVFPSTDTSVPQREQDIEKAKELLAEAGVRTASTVEARHVGRLEIPDLGRIVQNAAKEIGFDIKLKITDDGAVLRRRGVRQLAVARLAVEITDYGHRGVPNVFLGARCTSEGTWNAAHFKNAEYDDLFTEYSRRSTSTRSAASRRDPEAPARRDADHLPVLLLLPRGARQERRRRRADRHGPHRPRPAGRSPDQPGRRAAARRPSPGRSRMARFISGGSGSGSSRSGS